MAASSPNEPPQQGTFIYLGQPERAIAMLEEQYQTHYVYIAYLNVDPTYDSLREKPDFQKLLKKVGF
jgi:hypothetical protein